MKKDVTIIIPVKDRAALIARCLDSVAAQTVLPAKLIVVDNGSSDNTVDTVRVWGENHPEIAMELLVEHTPGASAARNRGLANVTTEYVFFFDSDDEMLPTLVEDAFNAIGDADLVYWKAGMLDLDGNESIRHFHEDSMMRRHFYNGMLCTVVYMSRTSLIRGLGGWCEKAMVWNDWELGVRVLMSEPAANVLPKVLVRIHCQENSITGAAFSHKVGKWENTLEIVGKNIRNSHLTIREKKRLLDMLDYRRMVLASSYYREGAKEEASVLIGRTLRESRLSLSKKIWLKMLYYYTRAGGRGAYYLWRR